MGRALSVTATVVVKDLGISESKSGVSNNSIYNVSEINIGRMDPTGKVYDQSGTVLGRVATEGSVYNLSGTKIGSVLADENVILIGGTARLLLYRSRWARNGTSAPVRPHARASPVCTNSTNGKEKGSWQRDGSMQ